MSISKVNVSGTDHQIVGSPRYATCSTAAATAAKVATIADGSSTFSLEKGARICVSFTYANTASAATLNVASTGAKAICWNGSALVSSQYWQDGAVVDFVYDGNGWSIVGVAKDNNSTNFLPLSGGSLTGNLTVGSSSIGTNGYIEGTWLKTTKATESAGNFATISGDGWIYKRAPANVLGDIGGQSKITANGILKGDGTVNITAADETEVELVDLPQEVFWATYGETTAAELNAAWDAGKLIKLKKGQIRYELGTKFGTESFCFYGVVINANYAPVRRAIFNLRNNTWEQDVIGYICDVMLSISLPTSSWTGSDPYTQTVTIPNSTANTKVDIQPSEELYDQLVADNVGYLAIKNVNGTLTAVAKGGKPSVDLTVQVTYNNVY